MTQFFVISSNYDNIETNLPIGKHTLRLFTWHFEEIVGKSLFRCFIDVFVSICCIPWYFKRFMLLNETLWLTVTHAFRSNGPKLANWSKWIYIARWSCFCSLLKSNLEVSISRLPYSFGNFAHLHKKSS